MFSHAGWERTIPFQEAVTVDEILQSSGRIRIVPVGVIVGVIVVDLCLFLLRLGLGAEGLPEESGFSPVRGTAVVFRCGIVWVDSVPGAP